MRFLSLAFLFALSSLSADFYVATNGSDANPGTEQAPFLTLERARDAVRALPSSEFKNQDVYVFLRGGTYRLKQTFVLTSEDSGRKGQDVVYSAYPGESVVLSGAVQVTNWTLHDALLGIYQAPIGSNLSRQLFVNGVPAQRARTTSYPAGFLPSLANGGIEFIITSLNPAAWKNPNGWTNLPDVEAVILTQWRMMRVPISSVIANDPNTGTGLLVMVQPAWTNANVNFDKSTNQPGVWSFWQVTWFENAYQFLLEPGQWVLDSAAQLAYYIPRAGENITTADVELPVVEVLVQGQGTLDYPIHNIRFEGLTFSYATWLGPSGNNGYVADQSGMLLLGSGHQPNYVGHDPIVYPTPGNIQFTYAHNIAFSGNIFQHLGSAALQFGTGSKKNVIDSNLFTDISAAAIELGGVVAVDHHPVTAGQVTENNRITGNLIFNIGTEYMDVAAIFAGFTRETTISHNTIYNTPWSGIAMGWGWGLLDKGSFIGLPNSTSGQWGIFHSLTPNKNSKITHNRIHSFLNVLWDGGAIYTTGQQGPSLSEGLLIKENVMTGKRPSGGGNTIYTDGGSRYIRVKQNVSYNNPIGVTFFGPPPQSGDPLPYPFIYSLANNVPYGSDAGGCRTYGDIRYVGNYWLLPPLPSNIVLANFINNLFLQFPPYSFEGFFAPCPVTVDGVSYPTGLTYQNNHPGYSFGDIPNEILSGAGVQQKPATIPQELWILP